MVTYKNRKINQLTPNHPRPDPPPRSPLTYVGRALALSFLNGAILGSALATTPAQAAQVQSWVTTEAQIHLIELFSSEGCSSCPPADRWLSERRSDAELWKTFIPIEWHVDYWNRLGWVDRFSRDTFTARQQKYAEALQKNTMYTPGFILDGKEWRPSEGTSALKAAGEKVGILRVDRIQPGKFSVAFTPTSPSSADKGAKSKTDHWWVEGALLANQLHTYVKAGENEGKVLSHEFVVVSPVQAIDLVPEGNHWRATIQLPVDHLAPAISAQHFSVAFWVGRAGSPSPVQVVGGDL